MRCAFGSWLRSPATWSGTASAVLVRAKPTRARAFLSTAVVPYTPILLRPLQRSGSGGRLPPAEYPLIGQDAPTNSVRADAG